MRRIFGSLIPALVLFAFLQSAAGCEKRPEPLDRDTIKMIDTMATKEIQRLRPELDSLCREQMEGYIRYYVDSLVNARLMDVGILKGK
jgi:hypothetical protein